MNGQNVNDLVKKAKKGDSRSFGELYGYYAAELYRFALYTLKNPHDAEDAVQNACIAAFRKIGDLRKDSSFKTWFFSILYNECIKIAGSRSRHAEIACDDMSVFDETIPDMTGSCDLLELLDILSDEQKAMIILSVFDGLNSNEIAEILGKNPSTVRSSLSRLLMKLRKQIEGADNE